MTLHERERRLAQAARWEASAPDVRRQWLQRASYQDAVDLREGMADLYARRRSLARQEARRLRG